MKLNKTFAMIAAAAALSAPLMSQATVALFLDDGLGNTALIFDGGVGDANGAANVVTFIGSLGAWTINVSTGEGVGAVPGVPFGIDLSSLNSSNGAGTLHVAFTENALNSLSGPTFLAGNIGGTTHGSVAYNYYEDNTNTLFGTQNLVFGGSSNGPGFSASGGSSVNVANPFSLTLAVDITHTSAGSTSFDFEGTIPEPTSIALVGMALLGMGAAAARRKA